MEKQHAELMYVYKKEPNPKAKERMLAVLNVVAEGETISTIAKLFRKSYNSIKNWVMRFKQFGIAGLVSVHVVPRKIRNVLKVCQICA